MAVFLRTDNHVDGGERLKHFVDTVVAGALTPFQKQVTRVDVFLGDGNGSKQSSIHDFRCSMEAHIGGLKPIAVTSHAGSLDEAIRVAAGKLESAIDHTMGRIVQKKGRVSFAGDPDAVLESSVE